MNANQLVNMVMNLFIRKILNRGVDAGLNKIMGGKGGKGGGAKRNRD